MEQSLSLNDVKRALAEYAYISNLPSKSRTPEQARELEELSAKLLTYSVTAVEKICGMEIGRIRLTELDSDGESFDQRDHLKHLFDRLDNIHVPRLPQYFNITNVSEVLYKLYEAQAKLHSIRNTVKPLAVQWSEYVKRMRHVAKTLSLEGTEWKAEGYATMLIPQDVLLRVDALKSLESAVEEKLRALDTAYAIVSRMVTVSTPSEGVFDLKPTPIRPGKPGISHKVPNIVTKLR